MGLLKDVKLESGINVSDAYHRVDVLRGNTEKIGISLDAYLSRDAFLAGKDSVNTSYYEFEPDVSDDAPNFIRQAYIYLKSIDNYEYAEDVLEDGQSPIG